MSPREKRIAIIMPAYNAAETLEKTYRDIPKGWFDDVILVDDCSKDNTAELAHKLGLHVIVHPRNRGYGGNQKTCYTAALRRGADIVVMLHPDYQYDPKRIPALVEPLLKGEAEVCIGSRLAAGKKQAIEGGMPLYKYLANRLMTIVENFVFRSRFTELHTGLRAYTRQVLETLPLAQNSDDFVFDSQVVAQVHWFGFKMTEISVPARYEQESSSVGFKRALVYGLLTMCTVGRYVLAKWGLYRSPIFEPKAEAKMAGAATEADG